jgi:hypothetical protein
MPKAGSTPRRRYVLFTRWRRRRFFALLEETGNVRVACELSGTGLGCIYRLRRVEAGFSEKMAAAKDVASRRLAGEDTPPPWTGGQCPALSSDVRGTSRPAHCGRSPSPGNPGEDPRGLVVRRGVGGRLRLMDPGPHWWEPRHDEIFLVHLRGTGNVNASARAAGFTAKVAHDRRKRLPAFAAAWERALPEAEMRLGDVLMQEAAKWLALDYDDAFAAEPPEELDVDRALAMLTYWNRKGKGRGPRGPRGG